MVDSAGPEANSYQGQGYGGGGVGHPWSSRFDFNRDQLSELD